MPIPFPLQDNMWDPLSESSCSSESIMSCHGETFEKMLKLEKLFATKKCPDKTDTFNTLVNVYVDLRVLPVLHRPEVVDIGVNTV